jgi:hypothetical protein
VVVSAVYRKAARIAGITSAGSKEGVLKQFRWDVATFIKSTEDGR